MKKGIGMFLLAVILFTCKTDPKKVPLEIAMEKFGNPIFEAGYVDSEAVVFDDSY